MNKIGFVWISKILFLKLKSFSIYNKIVLSFRREHWKHTEEHWIRISKNFVSKIEAWLHFWPLFKDANICSCSTSDQMAEVAFGLLSFYHCFRNISTLDVYTLSEIRDTHVIHKLSAYINIHMQNSIVDSIEFHFNDMPFWMRLFQWHYYVTWNWIIQIKIFKADEIKKNKSQFHIFEWAFIDESAILIIDTAS